MVLGIDTAGPVIGAALGEAAWSARVVQGADALLLPAIEALIARSRGRGELDAVAVSTGPGAFTGLRVGVATALGLAMGRGLRVVPLSALAARAALCPGQPRVLALLDARKGRFYAGWFDTRGPVPLPLGPERDTALEDAGIEAPFVAVGEGAVVARAALEAAGGELAVEADRSPAAEVARLGSLLAVDALDPGEVALRYLRAPDARLPAGPARAEREG